MCSRSCSIAPALYVSAAATTTENFDFCNKFAIFARVVVFPVPLIPTNSIMYGSEVSFFAEILEIKSILPIESKVFDILWIKLFFINSGISSF